MKGLYSKSTYKIRLLTELEGYDLAEQLRLLDDGVFVAHAGLDRSENAMEALEELYDALEQKRASMDRRAST